MSSIIKGERIRSQSVINFSERFSTVRIEYDKEEQETSYTRNAQDIGENKEILKTDEELAATSEAIASQSANIINEANEAAENIIARAKVEAERLIQEAIAVAEQIKANAQSEANVLIQNTQNEHERVLREANETAQSIREEAIIEKTNLLQGAEEELTKVLISLLQYLVSEEIYHQTDWISCIVKRMIEGVPEQEALTITISPNLYERLTDKERSTLLGLGENVSLETSNILNDTTCVVKLKQGTISYDLEAGLEQVIKQIQTLQKLT